MPESKDHKNENTGLRDRVESTLRDVIRKTVTSGQGAKQVTEDVIRGAISEIKMPKEVISYLIQQADNVKTEIVNATTSEIRSFLHDANIGEELAKILTTLSFEIRMEIRFIPNDKKLKPDVTSKIRLKRNKKTKSKEQDSKEQKSKEQESKEQESKEQESQKQESQKQESKEQESKESYESPESYESHEIGELEELDSIIRSTVSSFVDRFLSKKDPSEKKESKENL